MIRISYWKSEILFWINIIASNNYIKFINNYWSLWICKSNDAKLSRLFFFLIHFAGPLKWLLDSPIGFSSTTKDLLRAASDKSAYCLIDCLSCRFVGQLQSRFWVNSEIITLILVLIAINITIERRLKLELKLWFLSLLRICFEVVQQICRTDSQSYNKRTCQKPRGEDLWWCLRNRSASPIVILMDRQSVLRRKRIARVLHHCFCRFIKTNSY